VQYQWFPSQCALHEFDATRLDDVMRNRTIVFMGDSLMRQMFNSWRFLNREIWADASEALQEEPERWTTANGGTVAFEWTKYLIDDLVFTANGTITPPLDGWTKSVRHADVVVFNVGHHWHKIDEPFDAYDRMMDRVLSEFEAAFRGKLLVFRTSTPGHYGCDESHGPIATAPILTPRYVSLLFVDGIGVRLIAVHPPVLTAFFNIATWLIMAVWTSTRGGNLSLPRSNGVTR
jgi:hypothetical protein